MEKLKFLGHQTQALITGFHEMHTSITKLLLLTFCLFPNASTYALDISVYEKSCADIGFKKGTPTFGECVLELDRRASGQIRVSANNSAEDQQCEKFGFTAGTPAFADCRLKLEINKQEAAQRQAAFVAEQRRYQEQVAAAKKEKERQQGLALMQFGAALAGSKSPTFAGGIADANRAMGWAPPEPPKLQPFMIQGPRGTMTCMVIGNMYNCN